MPNNMQTKIVKNNSNSQKQLPKLPEKYVYSVIRYSEVVCTFDNKNFLIVQQKNNRWWIPGGKVQSYETFHQAAIREVKEESGIDIKIKGILKMVTTSYKNNNAWICVFFATPVQGYEKYIQNAKFATIQQILQMKKLWRGPQIYELPKLVCNGCKIYNIQLFEEEQPPTEENEEQIQIC